VLNPKNRVDKVGRGKEGGKRRKVEGNNAIILTGWGKSKSPGNCDAWSKTVSKENVPKKDGG